MGLPDRVAALVLALADGVTAFAEVLLPDWVSTLGGAVCAVATVESKAPKIPAAYAIFFIFISLVEQGTDCFAKSAERGIC